MSLKFKFIIFFSILVFLVNSGAVYFLNNYLENKFIKETADLFSVLAESSEGIYFSFIEGLKIRTIDWSSDCFIRNSAEKIINSKDENREKTVQELNFYLREKKIPYDSSVIIIDILDKDGIVISSSKDERLGIDEKEEEKKIGAHRFSEAVVSGFGESFVTSIIYEEDESDEPMIHIVSRIFSTREDDSGNLLPLDAVMLLHFTETERLNDTLTGKFQKEEGALTGQIFFEQYKTGEIYAVNNQKTMITPSRFIEGAVLNLFIDTSPIRTCLEENKEFKGEYLNYQGEKVLGASMCLKRDNAVLIVEAKLEEVLKPIREIRNTIILGGIAIFGLIIIGIILLSNWFLAGLLIIKASIEKIKSGDFSQRIETKSKDEIGYLGTAFNTMLDSVEKSEQELKKSKERTEEMNLDLENKVEERTGELKKLKNDLEKIVESRTTELSEKIAELEKFKELTVGRELKMVELKKEIEKLSKNSPK